MSKVLVAVAAAGALTACSEYPKINIFNNTGLPITVVLRPINSTRLTGIYLTAGKWRSAYIGEMAPPSLVIMTEGCTYAYELPDIDKDYYWLQGRRAEGDWSVQVDPDFTVALLPVDAEVVQPQAGSTALDRRYGYPVKPSAKACVQDAQR